MISQAEYDRRWLAGMRRYFGQFGPIWCEFCGKLVTDVLAPNQKYCGRSCRNKAYYQRKKAKRARLHGEKKVSYPHADTDAH